MSDNPRIDELKRRVQQDPASIAFAALADEYRRAGLFHDAVETCRAGLQRHPAYVSARVTLGRSLVELGEFQEAKEHLEMVLRSAPENLAAIRALADIHHRMPIDPAALQEAVEASSAAQTAPVAEPAPVPVPAPIPVSLAPHTQAAPVEQPEPVVKNTPTDAGKPPVSIPTPPAAAPLKLVAVQADSHPTIAPVTPADEQDGEELDIADLAPTMADAHMPVIHELEQFLAGIERARHSLGA
jgi:tetratricopeptide (TPR) repeat protein